MSKKEAKETTDPSMMLGRPGNNVKIGLVGLPNVGKSSLFNLLSNLQVAAENYPFCTIDPSTATVPVPDARFEHLCEVVKPKNRVQAVLTVTDIAGLVRGAHEGKGLGNAFLSHIQAVDAVFQVVRAFSKKDIEHVEGSVDPCRDLDIIKSELVQKDLAQATQQVEYLERKFKSNQKLKEVKDDLDVAKKAHELLSANKEIRHGEWANKDIDYLNQQQFLTAKPVVYLVNVSGGDFSGGKNKWIRDIKAWVDKNSPGSPLIPFSVAFEEKLKDAEAKGGAEARAALLKEAKVPSMMDRIITTGYRALHLINYFTVGEVEVRAWSIRMGTKAPAAGGVIHSDFERGFICADVYSYEDFKEYGSEAAVKAAGKMRMMGKEYVFKDGDIAYFKHNAKPLPAKK